MFHLRSKENQTLSLSKRSLEVHFETPFLLYRSNVCVCVCICVSVYMLNMMVSSFLFFHKGRTYQLLDGRRVMSVHHGYQLEVTLDGRSVLSTP